MSKRRAVAGSPRGKRNQKRRRINLQKQPRPQWIGEGHEEEEGVRVHYDGFELGGEVFRVGDCVGLQNPDPDEEPFVAKIVKLYQFKDEAEKLSEVQWFYRARDTHLSVKAQRKHDTHKVYLSKQRDVNEVSSIDHKCQVVHSSEYRPSSEEDTFFYDSMYSPFPAPGRFLKLSAAEKRQQALGSGRRAGAAVDLAAAIESDGDSDAFLPDHHGAADSSDDDECSADEKTPQAKRRGQQRRAQQQTPKKKRGRSRRRLFVSPSKQVVDRPLAAQRPGAGASAAAGGAAEAAGVPEGQSEAEWALQRLHVSAVPDNLPCREKEFDGICHFIRTCLESGKGACMYVSGTPGTGKTESIRAVARYLEKHSFDFVEINAMTLSTPQRFYSELWRHLSRTDKFVGDVKAKDLLHKKFTALRSPNRRHVVVLVDELDMLQTRSQDVLYNIFDWPNQPNARLVVVAAGNQMDLGLTKRVQSRLGTQTLHFQPYTPEQLCEILKARLMGHMFHKDAIQLCVRKHGSVSGDARVCLDICQRAIRHATARGAKQVLTEDIHGVMKDLSSSAKVRGIQSTSLHEKLLLIAVLLEFRATGREETTFGLVREQHGALCRQRNIEQPGASVLASVCSRLAACHFLSVEKREQGLHQTVLLGDIRPDEIYLALADDPVIQCLKRSSDDAYA